MPRLRLLAGLLMIFAFVSAPCAHAQFGSNGGITVSGDATVNVEPDKVQIVLGIESSELTVQAAKDANDASAAKVLEVTKQFQIDPKDVQTDHISIEPSYDDLNTSSRSIHPTHYIVRKSIVVTLHDIKRFDAFLSAAVESGANVVLDVQFLVTDMRKYRDEARTMAIKAAKEKADLLAGAIGQKAGKALSINEASINFWPASNFANGWGRGSNAVAQNYANSPGGEASAGDTTAPGQAKITANVSAVFQLE